MAEESEAVENASTGALVASVVDREPIAPAKHSSNRAQIVCPNCGALVTARFCGECAQSAHIHRSLLSLGHDILHSVFHFEGKFWRTLPALVLHPGQLTRRYIDGERAKFVSPMALFLFTVFTMFAVFSFIGGGTEDIARFQSGHLAAIEATDRQIADLRTRLADPALAPSQRAAIERQIADLESSRAVTQALHFGEREPSSAETHKGIDKSAPIRDGALYQALQKLNENPTLLLYKLKTNGYKFSWALVPLSIPFMWLLFLRRRDIYLYDHAVFVTYSISFMMLLAILASLLNAAGVSSGFLEACLFIVPPLHMYKQLRGAYGLSRAGALMRLFFLLITAALVLSIFVALLLFIGLLG